MGFFSRTCGKDQLGICCHRLRSINSWIEMPCGRSPDRWLEGWRSQRSKVPKVLIDANVVSFYERFNNHNFDLSHFGGIILFNSLNIFKPPFLGYRLEAWWKKNDTRSMNENRQTKRGLCLMMLHNTFTYHCFSCDVKPDRVSAREQYLHLLKVSSCKEYRIAFGNSLKFWSGMYACWSWHYCCCFCFLCFLLRALPLSLPSLLFPFFPHDRLMSKGPVIVPRMAFL